MKLYTVLGTYYGTQAEAHKAAREAGGTFLQVEVPTDKAGLIDYLNQKRTIYSTVDADYLDVVKDVNEDLDPSLAPTFTPTHVDKGAAVTAASLDLDEQWEGLPLARKLHFAALAVEDARVLVPGGPLSDLGEIKRFDTVEELMADLNDEEVDPFA